MSLQEVRPDALVDGRAPRHHANAGAHQPGVGVGGRAGTGRSDRPGPPGRTLEQLVQATGRDPAFTLALLEQERERGFVELVDGRFCPTSKLLKLAPALRALERNGGTR